MRHPTAATIHGVVHQLADDTNLPAPVMSTTLPAPLQHPTGQPVIVVQAAPTPAAGGGLSPVASRLLIGAGIGAGAMAALMVGGTLLVATLQAIATAMIAIGGCAIALAVTAVVLMRSFKPAPAVAPKKGRRLW